MTPPSLLISYWFWKDRNPEEELAPFAERPMVFADSGGFSADSVGAHVDLDEYASWLDRWRDWIDVACTLDVIGDAKATWENTKRLEGHGHTVLPVFHVGEEWRWMTRYCRTHRYVAVGGMVPWAMHRTKVARWLVRCFQIAREHGTVLHGLGQTNITTLAELPFYSVDSSSWVSAERFGMLQLWDPAKARLFTIHPSRERQRTFELGAIIRDHGLDPNLVVDPRFGRPKKDEPDVLERREQMVAARAAGLRAWLRLQSWWQDRHGPVRLDGHPDGPLIFFVCLDERQVRTALRVVTESPTRAPAPA